MSLFSRKARRHTGKGYEPADIDLVPMAWTDPWQPTHRQLVNLWIEIAHAKGYLVHELHDSRGEHWSADSGWPDVFVVKAGRAYAIELKVPPDTVTDEQRAWIAALDRVPGIFAAVFRSSLDRARDMAVIADILSGTPPTLPRNEAHL